MKLMDMTGKPCPIPVIQAKKELALPDSDGAALLVDNIVAVQNLQKMADGMGYLFDYEQTGDNYRVTLRKDGTAAEAMPTSEVVPPETELPDGGQAIVLITGSQMGNGSEELGNILMKGFLFSLTESQTPPQTLIFLNSGVQLAVEGSNAVPDLKVLADKGTKIYACGTCLNYYGLTEKLAAGEIVDMYTITEHLQSAGRLITL